MTRQPLRFLLLAAGLFAVAALGGRTPARQPAVPVAPEPKQTTNPDDGKAKKAPGRVLTNDSLPEMLDSMGYDFRTDTLGNGVVIYTLTIPSDTWKFLVEVSIAPNGSLVWLIAPLQQLPAAGAAPAEPLVRLLQENWAIYPHSFAIPKDSRRLYLQRALENQNMTPAKFRAAIDAMTGTIRSTAPLWDLTKWGQTPPTDGKKDSGGAAAYPDTAEGLTKLSKEFIAAAKAGKRTEVAAKVKALVLPNHDAWFKRVFGAETGAALSEEYAAGVQQLEASLTRAFLTAAEEGQTEVQVFKFTKPDPDNATPGQNKALEAMAVKTPLYSVYLTQPGEESGMHLYSFVYSEGAFRTAGRMKAVTVRASGFRGAEFVAPPRPAAAAPNGTPPQFNPSLPPFASPQLFQPSPLGFRAPAAQAPAANELAPEDFRHLAPLLPSGFGPALTPLGGQFPPKKKQPPKTDEPSVVGVWVGQLTLATTKWKVTTTLRADGTYKSVMESGAYVFADKGTYSYSDGILTTEPEGGLTGTFTVTFVDDDTIKVKGGGLSITYTRQ